MQNKAIQFRCFLILSNHSPVINGNATSREKDTTQTTLESRRNIQELANVTPTRKRNVSKSRILKGSSVVVAGQLRVLIDVVSVGVVLFLGFQKTVEVRVCFVSCILIRTKDKMRSTIMTVLTCLSFG